MRFSHYFCILCLITMIVAQEKTLITSCNVVKQKLEKKVDDANNNEHYMVTISGQFLQKDMQVFIGDYQVQDAKISSKSIQFIIRDKVLLKRLTNKLIAYRIANSDLRYSKVRFVLHNFTKRNSIKINSCSISQAVVRNPKQHSKKYEVKIDGDFPSYSATAINIFIGDYQVTEYGGTATGIYFYINDTKLLQNLHNKKIAYGYDHRIWEISTIKFQVPQHFLE